MNKYEDALSKYEFITVGDFIDALDDIRCITLEYISPSKEKELLQRGLDDGITEYQDLENLVLSYQLTVKDMEAIGRKSLIEQFKALEYEKYSSWAAEVEQILTQKKG